MASDSKLAQLQEHLASCALCQAVLDQMHLKCLARPTPTEDLTTLSEDQRTRVRRTYRLLTDAASQLESEALESHTVIDDLSYVISRAKRATYHVLKLGALTDSDLEFAGTSMKRKITRH